MDMTEIRQFNIEELLSKLKETRKEHMDLRFKKASMQLSDTTQIKKIKKDIARLETRLTELRFLKGDNDDASK
ncbi:MAG: 50S ribosomal protein L29 [Chloroflexi bacterium]|nr:50S ribosomal protein L29 [Chloroflexota bacterium]|tara:strand:+ start:388 stop:606 length:219 start_codon:yes stop_codon:yes gene_type:complete